MAPLRTCLLLFCAAALAFGQTPAAKRSYELGRQAEKDGRPFDAWRHYLNARVADPSFAPAAIGAEALRLVAAQTLAASGDLEAAQQLDDSRDYTPELPELVLPPDPDPRPAPRPMADLPRLQPADKRVDIRFEGTVQEAYELLADEFDLHALFEERLDVRKEVELELDDVDFAEALIALNDVAKAFVSPVTRGIFLVAEDQVDRRKEVEPVGALTLPIEGATTPEQVNEIAQAVQQTLDLTRSFINASTNQVVMRDTARKLDIARALYDSLNQPKAETMIEVELISVSRDRQFRAGVSLPTAFPITNFSTVWNNQPPDLTSDDATRLIAFGGGDTVFGVTVGSAALTAVLDSADQARQLQSFRLRAADGAEADLRIGERFPIINASFQPAVVDDDVQDAIDGGNFRQPIPSFTFEDLGLVFTVTPTVHDSREVTLLLEAEFTLLGGGSVNGVPILSNRAFNSQVRLLEGETAIVGGMKILEQRRSGGGLWPLAALPWIGRWFRSNTVQYNQTDLILTITPRIVRLPPSAVRPPIEIRYGPEERPLPAL